MKLLLHACCGPCSLEPVRLLREEGHDITIAYLNSNIAPCEEYQHRLETLLNWAKNEKIPVIEGDYNPEAWQSAINKAWSLGEPQQQRCRACYAFRFKELAHLATEHSFEGIGTTLSVSPYQFSEIIKEELERAASNIENLFAIFQDYRPYYPAATTRSRELGM